MAYLLADFQSVYYGGPVGWVHSLVRAIVLANKAGVFDLLV